MVCKREFLCAPHCIIIPKMCERKNTNKQTWKCFCCATERQMKVLCEVRELIVSFCTRCRHAQICKSNSNTFMQIHRVWVQFPLKHPLLASWLHSKLWFKVGRGLPTNPSILWWFFYPSFNPSWQSVWSRCILSFILSGPCVYTLYNISPAQRSPNDYEEESDNILVWLIQILFESLYTFHQNEDEYCQVFHGLFLSPFGSRMKHCLL